MVLYLITNNYSGYWEYSTSTPLCCGVGGRVEGWNDVAESALDQRPREEDRVRTYGDNYEPFKR